jgi:threonine aldolase
MTPFDDPIDLRSDAQTKPTPEMLSAVAVAELGDDTFGEDRTTGRLEAAIAERLGAAAAMLVLSGTMANVVALMTHCQPGDEVFLDADAHVLRNEAGGLTALAGAIPTTLPADRGHLQPAALERAIRPDVVFRPRPRLVWLENTHNRGGGSVLRPDRQAEIVGVARSHGLAIHLDGARIFNAAIALERPVAELTAGIDSVTLDFTKGLSCGAGAALVGSRKFIDEARRRRRTIGGGMRQAGVIGAACLVALETMVDRLADDHVTAARMAAGLSKLQGFEIDPRSVETNIVFADVSRLGGSDVVAGALRRAGVLVSTAPPDQIRLVTHREIETAMVDEALVRLREVAASLAGAGVA